uniref:Subtilase family n=1 Tax=Candidatus Kentrum sp. TUN TaxID=2126343 RepID=A0A451A522_9GAMM|nr:MAG: Subtilase family [Candidatus Kentron sp. TUN]VFK70091.1 MAG: Subtilase family [Candidatus Kentron sp. TUN]
MKVARGLTKFLAEGPPNNPMPIEVLVSVVRTPEVPLFHKMEKAAAEGKIRTKADHKRERERLLGERKSKIRDAKNSVLNAITGLGGEVLHNPKNLHSITARIPANAIDNLANRRDVARIDLNLPDQDEVDGSHMIEGHQIKQFIDDGYDGGSGTDIVFAQIEINGADDEHVGFRDGSGSSDRIKGMYNCYSTDCTSTSNFTSSQESDHASSVAGIIFGDLRDGQDTGVTSSSERIKRSGYAGEAHGWLYRAGNSASTMHAFDNMADKTGTDKPAVVNMSAGNADADPDCLGRTDRSKAVNELFESGILLIKSAGNKQDDAPQPPSVTDCRVTEPGSAIGAFTVASLGSNASSGDTDDVRDATISDFSSRGGTSPEGGNRTIVDLAAYGCRTLLFDKNGGYGRSKCGTSYAAPTVTATAINHINFYKEALGSLIDDPGVLFSNLLLMGDRQRDGSSSKMTSRFDNRYGAGALRARKLDTFGLDAPYGWSTGYTCIDDGEVHTITINNGNAISSDVEAFKAVIWWYDARHGDDGTLDDIDLFLKEGSTTLLSSTSYDNKERVFYDVGGKAVKLEIEGYDVMADDAGCGTDSMRVYYTYLYEDSDRDDSNGPGSEIESES